MLSLVFLFQMVLEVRRQGKRSTEREKKNKLKVIFQNQMLPQHTASPPVPLFPSGGRAPVRVDDGHVPPHPAHGDELLVADCAEKVLLSVVAVLGLHVHLQVELLGGSVGALVACVRLLPGVGASVAGQLVPPAEAPATDVAHVRLQVLGPDVLVPEGVEGEALVAVAAGEVLLLLADVGGVEVHPEAVDGGEGVAHVATVHRAQVLAAVNLNVGGNIGSTGQSVKFEIIGTGLIRNLPSIEEGFFSRKLLHKSARVNGKLIGRLSPSLSRFYNF